MCNIRSHLDVASDLAYSMLSQTIHPPARNFVCKTHRAAIAMSAWRWLVNLCGRARPRVLARAAAG
eukprot:2757055-Pyramimonas_sp.AAC.1